MPNLNLFASTKGRLAPKTDTVNEAGGRAYALSNEDALAQLVATGTLNDTYYADASTQLDTILKMAEGCSPEFVAQVAIYGRQKAWMKDTPALMLAHLASRGPEGVQAMKRAFPLVVDNGRMLRGFMQILRSGVTGRKSMGTAIKRMVRGFIEERSPYGLFNDAIGNDPSMGDIIRLARPRPKDDMRRALYGYIAGRNPEARVCQKTGRQLQGYKPEALPDFIKSFEAYKVSKDGEVPDVQFRYLTQLDLGAAEWTTIARRAPWTMTRMNLNTFKRHGVFESPELVKIIADRLRDPALVKKARVFPYQLQMAYTATTDVPHAIREALQDAMEVATENIPSFEAKKVYVMVDVSGSMDSPVTGTRKGSTTAVQCVDAAALFASCVLRVNRDAEVIPFHNKVEHVVLNPRDTVLTNAQKLRNLPRGGTSLSAPLTLLNQRKAMGDLIIYVSDNESWCDGGRAAAWDGSNATETMRAWNIFKARNPGAKMVCINLQPYASTQAKSDNDILNVGGFSDTVFEVIASFVKGGSQDYWAKHIRGVTS